MQLNRFKNCCSERVNFILNDMHQQIYISSEMVKLVTYTHTGIVKLLVYYCSQDY